MQEAEILRLHLRDKLSSILENIQLNTLAVRESVSIEQLATLTQLVVRDRVFLRQIKLEQPILVVVLAGTKTIYFADREYTFQAGELFFVPLEIAIDVVNQPDPKSNIYIALVLELSSSLMEKVRLIYPELVQENTLIQPDIRFDIPLSPQLVQSFIYLVQSAIDNAEGCNSYLNEHHIIEVILLLLQSELRSQILQLIYPNFLTYVTNLIRQDLSLPWSATKLAQKLNISVSTLKRKLNQHNVTFRQLLTAERMNKAMELLQLNKYTIAEIAIACGYESSSRFAARFRQHYNLNPSEVLANKQK